MEILDPYEWPVSIARISGLCRVSTRTVQRWLNGDSKPPHAAVALIQLTQRQRIMPDDWPNYFRFKFDGTLDVGHKISLTRYMLEHHAYSVRCWYSLIHMNKEILDRIEELEKLLPTAQVIDLANYRRRFNEMKSRPFSIGSGYEAPVDTNVIPYRNFPL